MPRFAAFADELKKVANLDALLNREAAMLASRVMKTPGAYAQATSGAKKDIMRTLDGSARLGATRTVTSVGGARALNKVAFDWHNFREGLEEEGVPLTGATIGAALGSRSGNVLRGAALGYAAGGAASIAKAKLQGQEISDSRKILAGGALGYGAGGMAHHALHGLTDDAARGLGRSARLRSFFHGESPVRHALAEEGLPALGATLGTATAMGMTPHEQPVRPVPVVKQAQAKKVR